MHACYVCLNVSMQTSFLPSSLCVIVMRNPFKISKTLASSIALDFDAFMLTLRQTLPWRWFPFYFSPEGGKEETLSCWVRTYVKSCVCNCTPAREGIVVSRILFRCSGNGCFSVQFFVFALRIAKLMSSAGGSSNDDDDGGIAADDGSTTSKGERNCSPYFVNVFDSFTFFHTENRKQNQRQKENDCRKNKTLWIFSLHFILA